MFERSSHFRHPKLCSLLAMLFTLQQPVWMLLNWGKDEVLALALACFALQAAAYALWFLALRPWVIRQLDGAENARDLRTGYFIFYILFFYEAQGLLAYCTQPNDAPSRLSLVFLISITFSVWCTLFFAADSPLRLLFHVDEEVKPRWGRLMPLTACALVLAIKFLATLGEGRAETIVYFTFCAECALALVYNGRKYGK